MARERVPVPGMPGRGRAERRFRLTCAATAVAGLWVCVREVAADLAAWPWALGILALLGSIPLGVWLDEAWLDTTRGRICRKRAGVAYVEVPWAEAGRLRIRGTGQGLVVLEVRSRFQRWSTYLELVACDRRGLRTQPAAFLWQLADEIRRWAPHRHHGVADELDAQAAHLLATGRIHDSPLLQRYCVRLPRVTPTDSAG